ncbi:MAG: hypothetical protein ACQR33_03855 [Candidatus Saccharibacteria bacterium]
MQRKTRIDKYLQQQEVLDAEARRKIPNKPKKITRAQRREWKKAGELKRQEIVRRSDDLITEVLGLLEKLDYPYAQLGTLSRRTYPFARRRTVAGWPIGWYVKEVQHSYRDSETGESKATHVTIHRTDRYLLETGKLVSSKNTSVSRNVRPPEPWGISGAVHESEGHPDYAKLARGKTILHFRAEEKIAYHIGDLLNFKAHLEDEIARRYPGGIK